MQRDELEQRIAHHQAVLAVVGLGYVGLPVACMFAQAGFRVLGVDIKPERVATINEGHSPIEGDEPGLAELLAQVVAASKMQATTDYRALADADVVFIDVETPVNDSTHQPEYAALRAVCRSLGPVLKPGALVIVESTIAPGTVRDVVRPLLEQHSGRKAGQDFFLGACPERVMPGKLLANLRTMSRVCGGDTLSTAQMMVQLYRHIVEADLDIADIITAELVKTAENAYRDVQIAFANEVALICEANGADVWQVRDLVNKSPFRQMHMPGAGVGGHCIPKDPWLLVYGAPADVPVRLIPAARTINESMPHHVAELTLAALGQAGQPTSGARVLVLGYAYLADSDDTRNSPSVALIEHLHHRGVVPVVHDPWVAEYRGDVLERAAGCVAAIFMVAHRAYNDLDLESLRAALAAPVLIDGRGMFEPRALQARGWFYRGVGR